MQNCSVSPELNAEQFMEAWPGHFFESWSSMLVALGSIVSILCHLWSERAQLKRWMTAVSSGFGPSACTTNGKHMTVEGADQLADEKKPADVRKPRVEELCVDLVNQRRVSIYHTFCKWIAPGAVILFVSLYISFQAEFGFILQSSEDNFALLNFYILCLLAQFGPWSLSPALVDIYGSGMSFVLLLRLSRSCGPANFFAFSNSRLAFRLGIGLCTLNHKIQGPWSILTGLVTAYKNIELASQVPGMRVSPALVIVSELFNSSVCWVAYYFVQTWLEEATAAMLDARSSSSEKSGIKRLLSVLCDGQVTLSRDYRIAGDTSSLSRILMSDLGEAQAATRFEGACFSDFLAAPDKSRFESFLTQASASDAAGTSLEHAPAGSLSVHMLDSAQIRFRVELFHVQFCDLNGNPLHLLGIRDVENRSSSPPQSSAASIVHSDRGFEMAMSQASRSVSESGSVTQSVLLKATRWEDIALGAAPRIMSSQSSGSEKSEHKMSGLELIEITVDPFAENLPITQCTFTFQELDEAEDEKQLPSLNQWLAEKDTRFTDWILDQVNLCSNGQPPSVPIFRNVQFRMPGRCDLRLTASICKIICSREEGLESAEERSSDDRDSMDVRICMSGLTSTRLRGSSRMKHKERSSASVRSSGSGPKELPSIHESVAY
eukprot:TRINITY_DN40814_c0_g1_i1.p1 TRINITY_DN40814_c0_g1~~TRINITY_DN40814_c0_g1_i1.p1  ORF type:complete len:678 (+),score=73.94 TRINITY_DN40814_c0_g1_i1:51-2036(+)